MGECGEGMDRGDVGVMLPQLTICWRHLAGSEPDVKSGAPTAPSGDVPAMHGAMHVSMQWWSACRFWCPKQSGVWGLWGREDQPRGAGQRACRGEVLAWDLDGWRLPHPQHPSEHEPSPLEHKMGVVPVLAASAERTGLSLSPCADDHGVGFAAAGLMVHAPCGVNVSRRPRMRQPAAAGDRVSLFSRRRRPSFILFLLGLRLAKLWAFPLVIRATAKGIPPWRMAPFILDDDRQSTETTTTPSTNPGRPDAEAAGLSSEKGSQTAEADRAEDISVALEWKLLFPLLAPGAEDPQPRDGRRLVQARGGHDEQGRLEQAHECVAQTIREAGEEAVTMHALVREGVEEKEFWGSGWVVKKANSAVPLDEETALGGYIWVPVEICSPKMRFKDPETRTRMHRVLDALNTTHRLAANCSCEVHIHLGRMDGRAWSLSTLQRLGSLLWAGEATLRSIRDPNSPNFDNTYTWGFAMRQRSRLAKRLEDSIPVSSEPEAIPDRQITDAIQGQSAVSAEEVTAFAEIWKATSRLELGQLLSGPEKMYRRLGFNFSAFGEEDERARRNPRTMEFRMMDGSVDTGLVLGWLAICGTIAETAVTRSDDRFAAALEVLLQRSSGGHGSGTEDSMETPGDRRGREFRELMHALGVLEQHYRGFEDKIIREHR